MAVPLVIVVGLLLGGAGSSGPSSKPTAGAPLPTLTVSAPPSSDATTISTCAQVISALPLTLDGQALRLTVSKPASPSIVAWGDPAIVLRCGVARPATLKPGSSDQLFSALGASGPYFEVTRSGNANVYTFVDRAVYIDATVPAKYNSAPLPTLATAIAKTLPAVCKPPPGPGETPVPDDRLCSRRK